MKNTKSLTFTTAVIATIITATYLYFSAQTGPPLSENTPTVETQVAPAPVAPVVEVADADRQLDLGEFQVAVRNGDATFEGVRSVEEVTLFTDTNRHGTNVYIMNFSKGFEVDGKTYSRFTLNNNIVTISDIDYKSFKS